MSRGRTAKSELAAEMTCLLAMTAIRNQDKIGLVLFSDRIVKFIPPRKGRTAVMRLVREVLACEETREKTDITAALRFLNGIQKRKAVVFLVSDFQDADYERELRVTARHHDIVACPIADPCECDLPDVGLIELQDPETGELLLVDTGSSAVRRAFHEQAAAAREQLVRFFNRTGIDFISASTDKPYIDEVRALFRRRARKH